MDNSPSMQWQFKCNAKTVCHLRCTCLNQNSIYFFHFKFIPVDCWIAVGYSTPKNRLHSYKYNCILALVALKTCLGSAKAVYYYSLLYLFRYLCLCFRVWNKTRIIVNLYIDTKRSHCGFTSRNGWHINTSKKYFAHEF